MTWDKSLNCPPHLQHTKEDLRQTTNPSIERDSQEKREERTEQLNKDYYFFTCETLTNNM